MQVTILDILESINIHKTGKCPDCGGEVVIRESDEITPNVQYWQCLECGGEAGIIPAELLAFNHFVTL